ncbi:MAG: alpha/beta fold hydrolase [Candidatus Lokiarchaeota archaeon]|nr:alpha/beta fold hydrolase [Candidatus Lokiarchaeota archaeon]
MNREYLKNEDFNGSFPFKPNYVKVNGFQMHYVDEGEGEIIVCLHGMPTWGYLYRNFIRKLSKSYRLIVPDQMGFGKSDVPQDKPYILKQHINNLKAFVEILNLKDIALIVQDWGGPIGIGYAVDNPDNVKRLIIMNTSIGVMKENVKPWYYSMEKRGIYDKFIKNIGGIMKMGINNKEKITPTLLEAYEAPFPNDESYIGALAWPKDIPVGKSHPSAESMLHIRENLDNLENKPKILIWGLKDPIFPPMLIEWWNKIYPGIETHKIEEASHFLQEDSPKEIIEIIKRFLQNN